MLDLQDLLRMVRRGWLTILAVTLLITAAAIAYVVQAPRVYVSSTTLYVTTSASGTVDDLDRTSTFASRAATTYTAVIDSPTVLQPVATKLGGSLSVGDLETAVQATHPEDTTLIQINAYGADPATVALIANTVATTAADVIPQLEPGPRGSIVRLQQTVRAEIPLLAVSPNVRNILQIGVLLGLVAGVAFTILRQSFDTRIRRREDVQKLTDAPVLAEVPNVIGGSGILVARDAPREPAGEAFRVLRTNLGFVENWTRRSIVICSAVAAHDDASVAANIAWTLAQSNNSVVLVDADLRRTEVNQSLVQNSAEGLADVLCGRVELHVVMSEPLQSALHVLPSGQTSLNPADLLSTAAMTEVLEVLERRYDFVIIDAPPIATAPDTAILASLAGGVLLVLPFGKSRHTDIHRAADALAAVRMRPAGLVMTSSESSSGARPRNAPALRGNDQNYGHQDRSGRLEESALDSPTLRQRPLPVPEQAERARIGTNTSPSPVPRNHGQAYPSSKIGRNGHAMDAHARIEGTRP